MTDNGTIMHSRSYFPRSNNNRQGNGQGQRRNGAIVYVRHFPLLVL